MKLFKSASPTGSDPQQGQIASIRRRLASMLYEILLLLGVLSLTFIVPYLILGLVFKRAAPGIVLWAHLFLVMGCYFIWYWRRGGQTLAMQTWRLKLEDAIVRGGTVPLGRAWLRYTLSWPSLFFFGAGILWALFDRDRQFLHDRLAGTRVIYWNSGLR